MYIVYSLIADSLIADSLMHNFDQTMFIMRGNGVRSFPNWWLMTDELHSWLRYGASTEHWGVLSSYPQSFTPLILSGVIEWKISSWLWGDDEARALLQTFDKTGIKNAYPCSSRAEYQSTTYMFAWLLVPESLLFRNTKKNNKLLGLISPIYWNDYSHRT